MKTYLFKKLGKTLGIAVIAVGFIACSKNKGNNNINPYGSYYMNGNTCMGPQGQMVDQSFCYSYGNMGYHMNGNTCYDQQGQVVPTNYCQGTYNGNGSSYYGGYYGNYGTGYGYPGYNYGYPSYGYGSSGGYCYYILGYMKCKGF